METPQAIRDHGWRQGSFLPAAALATCVPEEGALAEAARLQGIIISQDCDLVCGRSCLDVLALSLL